MKVAILGAHGKVGQQLMRLLYDEGHEFIGIARGEEHAEDAYRLGGEGIRLDLEATTVGELAAAFAGADAIVFAAGAGPGSGVARKRTVDYGASVLAQQAAAAAGIRRFVQISAVGVDDPATASGEEQWVAYVEAKRDADAELRASGLDWTIVRPGRLTLDEATGRIAASDSVSRGGEIPRADVAAVVVAALEDPSTIHKTFEVISGESPIREALAAL